MSSAAKFLLEFEARGDQEVVNKIKAVGQAGTEAASELQSLQGIEDPFSAIGEGADAAVAPIEGVGTAAEGVISPLTDLTTEGEAAATGFTDLGTAAGDATTPIEGIGTATSDSISVMEGAGTATGDFSDALASVGTEAGTASGGLTDANTLVGDFGEASATSGEQAGGLAEGISSVSGSIAAIGGAIGTAVSAYFRLEDANNRLFKAQNTAARAAETYRKAEAAIDKILATATSNTDGIAAARQRLADAQATVNEMQAQGVTSGEEYEAALAELQAAQAGLAQEAAKGGVDVAKLTDAMEKAELSAAKVTSTTNTVEKAQRAVNQSIMENVFAYTSLAGSAVQIVQGFQKANKAFKDSGKAMQEGAKASTFAIGGFGKLTLIIGIAVAAAILFVAAWDKIKPALENVAKALDTGMKGLQGYSNFLKGLIEKVPAWKEAIEKEEAAQNKSNSAKEGAVVAGNHLKTNLADLIDTVLGSFGTNMKEVDSLTAMGGAAGDAGEKVKTLSTDAQNFGSVMKTAGTATMSATDMFAAMQGTVVNLGNGYSSVNGIIMKTTPEMEKVGKAVDTSTGALQRQQQQLGYLNDIVRTSSGGYQTLEQATKTFNEGLEEQIGTAEELSPALEDSAKRVEETANAYKEAKNAGDTWAAGLDNQITAAKSMNQAMSESVNFEKQVTLALLETQKALIDEGVQLEAAGRAAQDASIQADKLALAKKRGTVEAAEFIAALDEEVAQQEAYDSALRTTVKSLGTFGSATVQSTEQLEQFIEVAARSPEALNKLADSLGKLAQDATKFLEFKGDEDELFGDWEISDKVPDEIKDMMTEADRNFIEGRAQLERSLEYLGPLFGVKAAQALQQGGGKALGSLREFGNQAADIVRSSVGTITPAVQELATAFDALGEPGEQTIDSLQRVVTAMENAESPAADLRLAMADLAVQSGTGAEQVAAMAGGLDLLRSSAANAGQPMKDVTLQLDKLNTTTITDKLGNVVARFAELNGQLVPIPSSAEGAAGGFGDMTSKLNPLNAAIQAAGASLTQFQEYLSGFVIEIPPVKTNPLAPMISASLASLDQFASSVKQKMAAVSSALSTGLGGAKQSKVPTIQINIQPAIQQLASLKNQINAVKQTKIPPIKVNIQPGLQLVRQLQTAINNIRQTRIPRITVNASQAFSTISRVKSQLNSLKNISRTITYRYRTVGSPPRGAQHGMHETLGSDTLIAAHKGERVDISPKGQTGPEHQNIVHNVYSGGARESTVSVPVFLDGKLLTRIVRRHLAEDVTAGM